MRFVREMESDLLCNLLRFCTGSGILLMDGEGHYKTISIRFTKITVLARRPVAHTVVGCWKYQNTTTASCNTICESLYEANSFK